VVDRLRGRFSTLTEDGIIYELKDWRPWEVFGWSAGNVANPSTGMTAAPSFAATLTYPARLMFQGRWGLVVSNLHGAAVYRSAQEPSVAQELVAMIAFAGEYFAAALGGGLLFADCQLYGFKDAKSVAATHNIQPPASDTFERVPGAPDGIHRDGLASALEFRDEPDRIARILIEHWLPAFCREGDDLFGWIR
jgi:hypothetical protein